MQVNEYSSPLLKQNGSVAERYSYDAYGRRRNPLNWTDYNVPAPTLINRGYTGHEMLDGFGLINMNGRMYDPVIGRVLSPDKFVQAAGYTQNYNRYSYCMNNPLKYTDPSGWYMDIGRGINTVFESHEVSFYTYGIGSPGNYYAGRGGGGGTGYGNVPYIESSSNGSFIEQLASSTQNLPNGYYNLTNINYNHGAFEFSYQYNSGGNEYYNGLAEHANKIAAFNREMTLLAASNIGYGKSFGGPYDDIVEIMREIWYSPIVRNAIPDLITVSLDFSCVTLYGGGGSLQLNFLTRGKDPGIFFTNTVSTRYGVEGDWGLSLGWANYQGSAFEITRQKLTGKSIDVDGGYIYGGNIWGGFVGNDLKWVGAKYGFGLTVGGSIGIGNTYLGFTRPTWP